MNKTVCIYPKDESTDFLSPLYDFLCEKGCEGLHKDTTENTDEAYALIKEADSIIFLGHGASDTLYGSPQDGEFTVLINETNIQELLYGKRCFILACNSYEFCENYNLTSFIGFGNMPTGIVDVKIAMEADTTFPSLEKEDIDTCWYGCHISLCVLARSGNDGFTGPFVSGRQWEILVCNKQGRL